tara:strand:+ start:1387 stop:2217 length:831 start_codon:yes stop_codon:yes gene_type:complete
MTVQEEIYPHIEPSTKYGRCYKMGPDGPWFGSVSTITHYGLPIDEHLMKYIIEQSGGDYMKSVSFHSEAAEIGTCVHKLAERYLNGEVIELPDNIDMSTLVPGRGYFPTYQTLEQIRKGFLSFIRFWEHNKPKLLFQEALVWDMSKDAEGAYISPYCGRLDTVAEIDGETWLLDLKTSKTVKDKIDYGVQLSMYKQLAEVRMNIKIDKLGIIHCNKMFKRAEPPKSVLEPIVYEYRPDLVHAAYTIFAAKFKGYEGIGNTPKIRPKTPTVFSLGGE